MAKDDKKGGGLASSVRQTAGRSLSASEAKKISEQTGASSAQVFASAQKQGVGIGSGAVNKFNAGKLGVNFGTQVEGPYGMTYNPHANAKTSRALGELGALRNLRMQPGTSYMGYSQTGGQYNPIVLPKDLLKGMGIGGKQTSGSMYPNLTYPDTTPGEGPGPWASKYGTTGDTTSDTTAKEEISTSPMPTSDMQGASAGDSFFQFGGASTWRSRQKGKSKGIKSTSAVSRGQRTSPSSKVLGV